MGLVDPKVLEDGLLLPAWLQATALLRERFPAVRVLILTTFDDEQPIFDGLKAGGADVAWIETLSSAEEVRAAAEAAIEAGMPYTATLSFDTAGRTMMGIRPDEIASIFRRRGNLDLNTLLTEIRFEISRMPGGAAPRVALDGLGTLLATTRPEEGAWLVETLLGVVRDASPAATLFITCETATTLVGGGPLLRGHDRGCLHFDLP